MVTGNVKRTTKQSAAGESTKFKAKLKRPERLAKLKHLKRLEEKPTPPKVKIKFTAIDEFGQTATDEGKVRLCSRISNCRTQPRNAGGTPRGSDAL